MLVVGSDPYYHVIGLEKAGAQRPNGATEDDLALMDRVAERHGPILDDAKATFSGALMLLCATPTQNEVMNTLCRRVNERLQALCAEKGVMFLDWWDELADPVTGRLRDAYCANAYPGDIHFTLEATQRFMELLKVAGQFSAAVEPSCAYDWSHVFECSVDAGEKTRIWCEPKVTPNNAFKSHKIASAHLGGRVADLMVALSAGRRENTMLMVNVRDGFLPVTIPAQAGTGTVAFTETEADFQTAQMTLDFYGRTDVALMRSGVLPTYDARGVSQAVLQIHPDTVDADIERCNQAIARLGPVPILVGTPFPDRIGALNLGSRKINTFQVSNRHIPEEWRNYAVVLAR